jgi:DNA-binding NarL/FixJ family response regulator
LPSAQRLGDVAVVPRQPIVVIDADDECRTRIAETLRRAGYPVQEAQTALQGLELARSNGRLLAAIIAIELPDATGYELCRAIRDRHGDRTAIFFLSATRTEPGDRVAGLLVGADDYLSKPVEADELLARLRRATRTNSTTHDFELTPRESEVLSLLARGLAQAQIAAELFISPRTVGTHIHHILRKLDVHSRAEAVVIAYRHGLAGLSTAIAVAEACLDAV